LRNASIALLAAACIFPLVAPAQDKPAAAPSAPPSAESQACEKLATLSLPHAKVTAAQFVAVGAYSQEPLFKLVPAFCRVAIESSPASDSDIKIEVWLPATGWNGKFLAQGNGGFAGSIGFQEMGISVMQGFATAGTDTGHAAMFFDATWAFGHPEKIADFGYRAIHEMTLAAKATIQAYYNSAPHYSYFAACSNGGRQALMEAQRFPDDYDGIIAGAPAYFWTHLLTDAVWNAQALSSEPGSYIPSSKLPAIAKAVNESCDKLDGVADGIINDPRQCHFDPAKMQCKGDDADSCLTAPQVTALKKLYQGAHDSHGNAIFAGYLPGAELGENGWTPWIIGEHQGSSLLFMFGNNFFANMVFSKPGWTYKDSTIDSARAAADEKMAAFLNATNPNLSPFRAHGGKLIIYHGWNDPAIPAPTAVEYYENAAKAMGQDNFDSFARLYMLPGIQHCGGGPGPEAFSSDAALHKTPGNDAHHNFLLALQAWVEKGEAPSEIIASKFPDGDFSKPAAMTRPLCPYPAYAKYKGTGDPADAANFSCAVP
jgi:Tannase and feruloyl esterase